MRFANPQFLYLLAIIPLLIFYYKRKSMSRGSALKFSNIKNIKIANKSKIIKYRAILPILRLLGLTLLILAFARPQFGWIDKNIQTEGIDILLALDVSYSMQAQDFDPNRLEKSKQVVSEFITGREYDRIGVVAFAATSFTLCPLTPDYGVVDEFIKSIDFGIVDGNSTAIGMGLTTAIDRLKNSKAKSKIIILLTDGENNAGKIAPATAADVAKALKIKVYTIGVGKDGVVDMPYDHPMYGRIMTKVETHIDEASLKEIADKTGGKYFRATDGDKLSNIYKEIDKMEKTKIEVKEHINYAEMMQWFAFPALLLLLLEILLVNTRFLKLP